MLDILMGLLVAAVVINGWLFIWDRYRGIR